MKKLLLIIAIGLVPLISICQQYNFEVDKITNDTLTDVILWRNIVVDNEKNIHVCWYSVIDPYNSIIWYSKLNCYTGHWSSPEKVSDSLVFSRFPKIAIEKSTGTPHILYNTYLDTFNMYSSEIVHAYKLPSKSWKSEFVTNDSLYQSCYDIAIDENNKCHIVGTSSSDSLQRVFYSNNISGNWESQILTDNNYYYSVWTEFSPSIAVTSEGIAHIAFIAKTNEVYAYTRLATNNEPNGTNWVYEMIETTENNDFSVKIAIQSDSILHTLISGNEGLYNGPNNCYYTKKDIKESFWYPLEFVNSFGGVNSMIIDKNGEIHALQIPGGGGVLGFSKLSYTTNQTGIWTNTLVKDMITGSFDSFGGGSIAITSNGRICIAASTSENLLSKEIIVIRTNNHCDTTNSINTPVERKIDVFAYPNPFQQSTTIWLKNPGNENHTLQVFNLTGKNILEINKINSDRVIINRGTLASGLYIYKLIKRNSLIATGKLLIK